MKQVYKQWYSGNNNEFWNISGHISLWQLLCVKCTRVQLLSGLHIPAFGLNTGTLGMKVIKINNNIGVNVSGNRSKNHEIFPTANVKEKKTLIIFQEN